VIALLASPLGRAAAGAFVHHRGYERGRADALAAIRRADDAAIREARRAREDHARSCARDGERCLHDGWTRDP
jgi:hypothetical protein